jgi:hypothetical protein
MVSIAVNASRYVTRSVKYVATGLGLAFLLAACQQPEQKVADAKANVATANQDLKEARRDAGTVWQETWLKFKRDNDESIASNERRILELRKEVAAVDARYRATYTVRIDKLEARNNEIRDRVNNVKDEGDARWETFKSDTKHDLDDLTSSLENITVRNG